MDNNDILRRIRYCFELSDSNMMAIFASGGHEATRAQISDWLKREEDPAFVACNDRLLAIFLNGFINEKRGKREGDAREPEDRLHNNLILRKLKIALDLKNEEVLDLLDSAGFQLSKHELSAFFRKPGHKHYRVCKDQVIRNLLKGLQKKHRPAPKEEVDSSSPWASVSKKLLDD